MIAFASTLVLGLSVCFLYIIYNSQSSALKIFYWPGLLARLFAGGSLGLIYSYYYSVGDTFGFFNDALKLTDLLGQDWMGYFQFLWIGDGSHEIADGLINVQFRSLFLVKILSVVLMVSFKNYWIASFYFSLCAFLGSWFLISKINLHFEKVSLASVISFLFFPSFIFWSSGIIKESLAIAALMFLAGITLEVIKNNKIKWWELLVGLIALYVLWNLKYYWAALFIPAAITTVMVTKLESLIDFKSHKWIELPIWLVAFFLLILVTSTVHPNFYLSRVLSVIVENYYAYSEFSEKPFVQFSDLQASWLSLAINSPWALFSGLFRPMIFEANSFFQFVIGVENMILFGLAIYNFKYLSHFWSSRDRLLIFSVIIYIGLLAIFLTISTPNFGTLSRYRAGFLPFMLFLLLSGPLESITKSWNNSLKT